MVYSVNLFSSLNRNKPVESQSTTSLLPIKLAGEVPTIASVDFAAGLGIQHKNLLETIRSHQQAIEKDFGPIAFETGKPSSGALGGRPTIIAHLTEDQALFVGTISRNSKRVIEFKSILIRSFAEARKQLRDVTGLPVPESSDKGLAQLLQQQQQLMSQQQQLLDRLRIDQQIQLDQIRADMALIQSGIKPSRKASRTERPIGRATARYAQLRHLIAQHVDRYCEHFQANPGETYHHLYRCMQSEFGINVFRLGKRGNESLLDAIERHGFLNELYAVLKKELPANF